MAKMKALLPTALLLGGAYILPPAAFAQTMPNKTVSTQTKTPMMPNAATFDALLATPKLIISDADANRALKEMGLDEKGSGAFTWGNRTGESGHYVFTDVRAKDRSGTLSIHKMTLSGVRMDGKDVMFDSLDLRGVRNDAKKTGILTFDRISMSRPSPEVVEWVADFFDNPSSLSFDEDDYEPDLDAFGAFYISNLKMESKKENATGHVAELGWGTGEDNYGTILIRDAKMTGEDDKNDLPVDINIGLLTAKNIDMKVFQDGMDSIDFSDLSGTIAKQDKSALQQDPFSKKYDHIQISDFYIAADTAKLHLEDMTASQHKSGSVLSSKLNLKPLSFGFSGEPTDPELLEAYESLKKAGFENLSLTMTSDSSMDEAKDSFTGVSHFNLVDLISMGSTYSGNGFGDFVSAMRDVKDPDNMTDDEALDVFSTLSIDSMTLSLRDVAMIDKILTIAGKETGETPDMLKTKGKSLLMMGALMAQNPSQMALAGQASTAFSALLDEGGEVTIKLAPETPLTLETFTKMDFDNPKNIDLSKLGLSITHNK